MHTDTGSGMERRFGLLQATALNMTNMLGAGPFITIPLLMAAMGGPQSMLGWALALIITLADGLVWSELGAAMPGSGGTYGFMRQSFGPKLRRLMCFMFVWQLVISGPMEIGSALIGIRPYLAYVWPDLGQTGARVLSATVALVIVWLLYRRIHSVARLTLALWVGVLITVGVVIITGALHFDSRLAFDFPNWWHPGQGWSFWLGFLIGLGQASSVGIFDYLGYYDVCYIGDEVKNPGRNVPRAVIFSLVGVALIYVCIHLAFLGNLPWRDFIGKEGYPIAAVFMEKLHGHGAAIMLTLLIIWTTYAGVFALMLGYSRVPYAAARGGDFFGWFGQLHEEGFPARALLVIGALSVAFSFWDLTLVIQTLLAIRFVVQFIGQIFALMWLRKHRPEMERPFKMWLYPLPCFVALAGWLFLIATLPVKPLIFACVAVVIGVFAFGLTQRKEV